jgi:GNAT superfamily N-acetyltransferase
MRLRFEPTENKRFNLRIARLQVAPDDTSVAVPAIVELARAEQVEMLTLRLPCERIGLVQDAEGAGFRLMDSLLYYEAAIEAPSRPPASDIRFASAADADSIEQLACLCFADYPSHYHADRRLDRRLVAEGYAEWARRSCLDKAVADAVIASVDGERIRGFGTVRRNDETEGEGVLFAVHPDFTGAGVFGALVDQAKRWCADSGLTRMIYSTQLDNRRVQRALTNRGFRLSSSWYTLHRWFI